MRAPTSSPWNCGPTVSRRANCGSRRADKGDYGVPHATVRCEDGKIDPALLRASLGRFNETTDQGWRWAVEALAAQLLHDLCGVALVGWLEPPDDSGDLSWRPVARQSG